MEQFLTKKNILNLLILGIVVLAIPLSINLIRQQQILKSSASVASIEFLDKAHGGSTDCVVVRGGKQVANCPNVSVKITAPTGSDIHYITKAPELVSKVYAQECETDDTCPDGNLYCQGSETWQCYGLCSNNECELGYCGAVSGNSLNCGGGGGGNYCNPPQADVCDSSGNVRHQNLDCTITSISCNGNGCSSGQCNSASPGGYCTPGDYKYVCNSSCGSCASDAGQADIIQCNAAGTYYENIGTSECRTECNGQCTPTGGGGVACDDSACGAWWGQDASCNSSSGVDRGDGCFGGTGHTTSGNTCDDSACGAWWGQGASCSSSSGVDRGDGCFGGTGHTGGGTHYACSGTPLACHVSTTSTSTDRTCGGACAAPGGSSNGTLNMAVSPTTGNVGSSFTVSLSGQCGTAANTSCQQHLAVTTSAGVCNTSFSNATLCPNWSGNWTCTAPSTQGNVTVTAKSDCTSGKTATFTVTGNGTAHYACSGTPLACHVSTTSTSTDPTCGGACPASTPTPTPQPCPFGAIPLLNGLCPTTTTQSPITQFRAVWGDRTDLNDPVKAPWQAYPPLGGIVETQINNITPGPKFLWVQFGDSSVPTKVTDPTPKQLDFSGPDPAIIGCTPDLDLTDNSLNFTLTGQTFGSQTPASKLSADGSNLVITSWADGSVVGKLANPASTATGHPYNLILTRQDGVTANFPSCTVGVSQIKLGANWLCQTPAKVDLSNVDLSVFQMVGVGATGSVASKAREKVTVTDGVISNIKTKIKQGAQYVICLKALHSLRLCTAAFSASSGTNDLSAIAPFNIPFGDLNDDGTINSPDASKLRQQWGKVTSGKNCDFNGDGICNSFEWSCMLRYFNKSDSPEPQ